MPFKTLTGTRFSMTATLLRQTDPTGDPIIPTEGQNGNWVTNQDPLSGEIVNVWQPVGDIADNQDTPAYDPVYENIPCLARGIVDGGIRVAGSTERFGDTYENIDYAKLWVPASVHITKRDRVTNIRTAAGVFWRNFEYEKPGEVKATVFNVNGVSPLFDAFNRHIENFILLERAEV